MPAHPSRRIVARAEPRHAGSVRRDGPRTALGVISLTVVLVAVSYPRGAGAMFADWLRLATITIAPLLLLPPRRFPAHPWLVLTFIAWTGASLLWSQDASLSAEAALTYTWIAVLAYGATTMSALRTVTPTVALALGVTLAMSLVATAIGYEGPRRWAPWGEVGPTRVFQGLFGNRNIIGYSLMMLLPAAAVLTFRRRRTAWVGAALTTLTVVVIVRTGSTTSLVTAITIMVLAAALPLLRSVRASTSKRARRTVAIILTLVAVSTVPVIIKVLSTRDLTLSGRTPFWKSLIQVSSDRPLTGFGWGTVWNYHWQVAGQNPVRDAINDGPWSPLAHGHNAMLDVLPQVGAIGVLLLIALQLRAAIKLVRAPRSEVRTWGVLTLVTINMIGLTEPSWAIPLGWGLLVVVATVAERLPTRDRRRPPPEQQHSAERPWQQGGVGHAVP